jgi:hypothetical protein
MQLISICIYILLRQLVNSTMRRGTKAGGNNIFICIRIRHDKKGTERKECKCRIAGTEKNGVQTRETKEKVLVNRKESNNTDQLQYLYEILYHK